jgi:hypothetical protein
MKNRIKFTLKTDDEREKHYAIMTSVSNETFSNNLKIKDLMASLKIETKLLRGVYIELGYFSIIEDNELTDRLKKMLGVEIEVNVLREKR